MAIAPITLGDTGARAKINAAIAKANEVDSKADVSALASAIAQEKAERSSAIAIEAVVRDNAVAAERAERIASILEQPLAFPIGHRPGDAPQAFGRSLADGEAAGVAVLPLQLLRYDDAGRVVRLTGDGVVAPRHLYPVEPDRRYLVTFAVQRRVNSPDPDNDAIRCAVAWYGQSKGRLSGSPQSIVQDVLGLTTGSGRQVVTAMISAAAGDGVDIVAPVGARYARPYVETFGTRVQSDVEIIDWQDVTDAEIYAPDVSALASRVSAIEGMGFGDRLDIVEAQLTAPNQLRVAVLGDLEAANVPATVDTIELLGHSAPGRGGGRFLRTAPPGTVEPWHVQSLDGAWWIRSEQHSDPAMFGAQLDGVADDRAALADAARFCSAFAIPMRFTGILQIATPLAFIAPFDLLGYGRWSTVIRSTATTGDALRFDTSVGMEFRDAAIEGPSNATAGSLLRIEPTSGTTGCVGARIQSMRFFGGYVQLNARGVAEGRIDNNLFSSPVSTALVYGNELSQYVGRTWVTSNRFIGRHVWAIDAQIPDDGTTACRHISGSNFWFENNYIERFQAGYTCAPNILTAGMFLPSNLFFRGNNIQYANTAIYFAKPLGVGFPTYANLIITSNIIVARYCITDNLDGSLGEWVTNAIINDNAIFPTHDNCIGIQLSLNCAKIEGNQFDAADPNNAHSPFPGSVGVIIKNNSYKVFMPQQAWSVIATRFINYSASTTNNVTQVEQFYFQIDPPSIPAGGTWSKTYGSADGISHVRIGDYVKHAFESGLVGLIVQSYVSNIDEIRLDFYNPTASPVDIGDVALRLRSETSH